MIRARLSDCRQNICLAGDRWSEAVPISALPGRLRFYEGLRDRAKGSYAVFYASVAEDLARILREITAAPAPPPLLPPAPAPGAGPGRQA